MLEKMRALVTERHKDQTDRAGKSYVLHLERVLAACTSESEEVLCAALGHDILEDTETTPEELLEMGFTQRTVDAILSVTKLPGESYEEYVKKVLDSEDGMCVKYADLSDNMRLERLPKITEKDLTRWEKYATLRGKIAVKMLGL